MDEVIIIILVVLVLIGLGVGAYFLLQNKRCTDCPTCPTTCPVCPEQVLPNGWKLEDVGKLKNTLGGYIQKNLPQKQVSDDMMNCIVSKFIQNLMKKSKFIDTVDKIAEFLVNMLNFNAYNVQTVEVYITYNYAALSAIYQCIAQKDWDIVGTDAVNILIKSLQQTFPDLKIQTDPVTFKNSFSGMYSYSMMVYLTAIYDLCKVLIKDESKFPQALKDFKADIAKYGQVNK
jgi:hypothetical protein